MLQAHYDWRLVGLSVAIAIAAAYTALDLAGRIAAAHGRTRLAWLIGGATSMGLGIWAMHYIGMLAYQLPLEVFYSLPEVGISLLAAIAASAVALYVVSAKELTPEHLATGSLAMGGGIATMHYVGMRAMRVGAHRSYSPGLVALSILVAVVVSAVALFLAFRLREEDEDTVWARPASAVVMGFAVAGMHYLGMAAVCFHDVGPMSERGLTNVSSLGVFSIATVTFTVLALSLVGSIAKSRFTRQQWLLDSEQEHRMLMEREIAARIEAEVEVRRAYERMEELVSERTAELQESQAKWKGLVAALPQLIWTTDPDGRITFVSDACMRYSGTTEEDLMGTAFVQCIHPDDRERVISRMAEAHAAQIPYTLELRLLSRDGEYRWFQNRGQPVYEVEGGPPRQWLGSSTDIDDQKRGKEVLEEAVAQRTVALEEAVARAKSAVQAKEEEIAARCAAEAQVRLAYERMEALVTERTAKLQDAQAKWKGLVAGLPQLIWIVGTKGECNFVSEACVRYSGLPEEKLLGWGFVDHVHPDDREHIKSTMLAAFASRSAYQTEIRLRSKQGSYRWFLIRSEPVFEGEGGPPTQWLGSSTDIDDQKRSHELLEEAVAQRTLELKEAVARAEYAARAKSDFLAVMSHEIRTPMNGVIGMAHLMMDTPLNDRQRGYLDAIRSSGQALLTIINDILDFSKIEAGKLEIYEEEFDPRTVAGECMDLVGPGASRKQLALTLEWDDTITPRVIGDSGRLRQILLNLLSNAIKFTPAGAVSLGVSRVTREGTEMLRFTVRDSGIGLSPVQIGTLFQAFAQADISTTRRFGGTGLGLSIAKRLVELMGGRIGVDSRVGDGSMFWFELPLKVGTAVAAESAPKQETPRASMKDLFAGTGLRVLIADDVVTNQMVARGLLGELGLRADAVSNGAEAIAVLDTIHYDLVLMDVHMPEMDGLEATRRIRERAWDVGRRERLPVIALTASAMPGDRQKFLEAGMDDFISKPIMPAALVAILRKWLPVERTQDAPMPVAPMASGGEPVCVFDRDGLLSRVMGDGQLANAVLEGFRSDMPGHVQELLRVAREGALEEAADLAHRVRGAAATVGGETVRVVAEEMETAGRAGDPDLVRSLVPKMELQFARLMTVLEAAGGDLLAA